MSYLGRTPTGPIPYGSSPRSSWRWFPHWLIASMFVVFMINGWMVWDALSTFPGLAVENDFDHSNSYDQVLETARKQAALGWALDTRIEEGRPVLVLTARDGSPLTNATISATARRPLGPPETARPGFSETAPGAYRAAAPLALPGQWDLLVTIRRGDDALSTTRRIVVK